MSLLLTGKGFKELSYDELLAVNGGCSGYSGVRVSSPTSISGPTPIYNPSPVYTSGSSSCSGTPVYATATAPGSIGPSGAPISGPSSCNGSHSGYHEAYPMPKDNNSSDIKSEIQKVMNDSYVFGQWDCDIFVESVLKACENDISGIWGAAASNNVQGHVDKLAGQTTTTPNSGWSVVMMTDSDKYSINHCGLAYVNTDGSVSFYNNTKSAGHVILESYDSVAAFQKDFAYKKFDYYSVDL